MAGGAEVILARVEEPSFQSQSHLFAEYGAAIDAPKSELLVESDGRGVALVRLGLDESHALLREFLHGFAQQKRRHSLPQQGGIDLHLIETGGARARVGRRMFDGAKLR